MSPIFRFTTGFGVVNAAGFMIPSFLFYASFYYLFTSNDIVTIAFSIFIIFLIGFFSSIIGGLLPEDMNKFFKDGGRL